MLVLFSTVAISVAIVTASTTETLTQSKNSPFVTVQSLTTLAADHPEELVNVLGGTDSRYDASHGSSLPLICMPWGFNTYAPQTDDDSNYQNWWFHPYDRRFFGLRVTHQPSPWIADYGSFLIKGYMPKSQNSAADEFSGISAKQSVYSPYYFKTALLAYATSEAVTTVEFTPTMHGGAVRFSFPKFDPSMQHSTASTAAATATSVIDQDAVVDSTGATIQSVNSINYSGFDQTRRIAIKLHGGNDMSTVSASPLGDNAVMLSGYTTQNSGGVGGSNNFAHYFAAMLYGGREGNVPIPFHVDTLRYDATSSLVWVDTPPDIALYADTITVRFATSFLSVAQAVHNLQLEVAPKERSFTDLVAQAKQAWNAVLRRSRVTELPAVGDVSISSSSDDYSVKEIQSLLITYYSSLFRASLFPRNLAEVSKDDGSIVHWSPYMVDSSSSRDDGAKQAQKDDKYKKNSAAQQQSKYLRSNSDSSNDKLNSGATDAAATPVTTAQPGPLSTDSGFWDAWNTVYPLLALFHRPQLGAIMDGWMTAYREGGWLPKWASPGYRGSMVGTMGDVSVASAIVNEIPGFDVPTAYAAIRKDAFEVPPSGAEGTGRECLSSYLQYGYVPRSVPTTTAAGSGAVETQQCSESVSRSLNYLQSDYAIAQAALKLGHSDDAAVLLQRSMNYSRLFDPDSGFFRSKDVLPDGKQRFTEPFDAFAWGGDYTEGGPYQFRFYVPHDPRGLAALYRSSGRDICDEMERIHTAPLSVFHIGGYSSEIHEMTELADHCWGQYSHNNQPIHHLLYMNILMTTSGGASSTGTSTSDMERDDEEVTAASAGSISRFTQVESCAPKAQYWLRQTLLQLYTSGADMFPGDEDNGEMGAWFVLSALGLYEVNPGSGEYVLGAPLFSRMEIDISDDLNIATTHTGDSSAGTRVLKIIAENNSKQNVYVQQVLWNGQLQQQPGAAAGDAYTVATTIPYSSLRNGGTLTFVMGAKPLA